MKRFYQPNRRNYFIVFLLFFMVISISGAIRLSAANHFTTVWQGQNGQNHMNFMIVSAVLENQPLSVDDELAVFSGTKCVGATKLLKAINPADKTTFLSISASQDDGSGNGFTENDTVIFKIWDNKNLKEIVAKSVVYRKDISTWLASGRFSASATSVVEITHNTELTQTIQFIKGNNLFSTYIIPTNPDLSVVFKSLCDSKLLLKIQDEVGNTLAPTKSGGWVNKIGSIQKTEGYLVSVSSNCTVQINGQMIDLPLDIPLNAGWNFISFPSLTEQNAMTVVQSLIDQNKLVKVQDELGNSIENLKRYGGWKNSIGNFKPGKAYKVNVSTACTLTLR
ncbi:MAG: hypothetical protein PHP53_14630 [Prolixibacteraceae bacterium]|nr:hypothetical protein [Prolixibacteraceae bacterium]